MLTNLQLQHLPQTSNFALRIHNQDVLHASAIGARALYGLVNDGKDTTCTAYLRWQEEREETVIDGLEDWKSMCTNSFRASRETKLQSLHSKIIHRIFPCGTYPDCAHGSDNMVTCTWTNSLPRKSFWDCPKVHTKEMSSTTFYYLSSSTFLDKNCFMEGTWTCSIGWLSSG